MKVETLVPCEIICLTVRLTDVPKLLKKLQKASFPVKIGNAGPAKYNEDSKMFVESE